MEEFGQIICNRYEELSISLKEVCDRWHVEFRVHTRVQGGAAGTRPGKSIINLPIEQLPLFLDRLGQVRDSCVSRGQLGGTSVSEMVVMDQGERVVLQNPERLCWQRVRQYQRFPVRYGVVCQPLPTDLSPRPPCLMAEFRDLSVGGAQILLPCRLDLGQQVEVAGLIEGQPFRAKAEVVGGQLEVGGDAKRRRLRHSIKWLTYNSAAADILTMALLEATGNKSAQPDTVAESGTAPEQVLEEPATIDWPTGPSGEDRPAVSGARGYSREIGRPLGYAISSPGPWSPRR